MITDDIREIRKITDKARNTIPDIVHDAVRRRALMGQGWVRINLAIYSPPAVKGIAKELIALGYKVGIHLETTLVISWQKEKKEVFSQGPYR